LVSEDSRGVAQPGSATALGAVGREFESLHPDQNLQIPDLIVGYLYDEALVAHLDRASAF
jgi:hypothetical protein